MKGHHYLAGLALLATAAFAAAQSEETDSPPTEFRSSAAADQTFTYKPVPAATAGASDCCSAGPCCDMDGCTCPSRFWASVDYLLWWEKAQSVPVPLVTTNSNPAQIGALGESDTRILFGGPGAGFDYGAFSGVRATVGGWFDCDQTIGGELSGFIFGSHSVSFNASSTGAAPFVAIPFNATVPFNLNPAGESSLNPGLSFPNAITVSSSSRLWGFEANNVFRLGCDACRPLTFLAGFRFLQLDESLTLNDTFVDTTAPGTVSVTDSFQTRNQFYGAQIGVRGEKHWCRLSAEATLKCAFGVDYEQVDIAGNSAVTNGAFGFPTGTFPGGVFAQPSNSGRHTRTSFAVVPEAQLNLGYNVGQHLRLVVGYDFLYINDVVRPGAQIDRNVNPTQNVLFGGTGGVLTGPPAPLGGTHASDFWAQGMNFGVQFRF